MERNLVYEKNNTGYNENNEFGIKCKNYELCEDTLPDWWFDCKNSYLCTNCHILFGTWGDRTGRGELIFVDDIICSICLKCKRSVSQPKCDHYACIECFKRCYYGEEMEYPQFPYPDIESEYDDDPMNPKWVIHYPLIAKYDEHWNRIDEERERSVKRQCVSCL
jgi:hypothetical protein